jgi:hypothetical protein
MTTTSSGFDFGVFNNIANGRNSQNTGNCQILVTLDANSSLL